MSTARIALGGIYLESNARAPVCGQWAFRNHCWLEGDAILEQAGLEHATMAMEMTAFVRAMSFTGEWLPQPLVYVATPPGGPADHDFFEHYLDVMEARLRQAMPLDGVFLANHGAMTTTRLDDADGEVFERVRSVVGTEIPLIAVLDLHANISQRMAALAMLVGYRTNPHVDMLDRGEEAAFHMRRMLAGQRPAQALVRLPLVAPSTTLLTADGPYGELIDYGQQALAASGGEILNVSLFGGFAFSDTDKNGFATVVSARHSAAAAQGLAIDIASRAWRMRDRFVRTLMPITEAVALAQALAADRDRPAAIFSDAGDNPGGGGTGNTTALLEAMIESGTQGVLYGSLFDPPLADDAHAAGPGAQFTAVVNRDSNDPDARRLSYPATVVALHQGEIVGRLGIFRDRALALGNVCALRIGGVSLVVISARQQTADPVFFECLGLDIAAARTVCVKSRGHFRAGFAPWFPPPQVFEVDTPGLTSPVLERLDWRRLPRPVYPLDQDTRWTPPG